MEKALIVTSVASMVDQFLIPSVTLLQDMGYTVEVACNFETGSTCSKEKIENLKERLSALGVKYYHIDFARSVLSLSQHIRAYKQVKQILTNDKYELMHCHSPIGGLISRLACRKARKSGTRVFYTAHGFHFYKGAPLKNWLLYYPVEKFGARFTDVLITINKEDYSLAQRKMKARQIEYVAGVGIDLTRFGQDIVNRAEKRKELCVPSDATVLLSVGELNENKNHETVIRAIKDLVVYYIIAGKGDLNEHLQSVIDELGLTEQVKLLGYRTDVSELYRAADIYVLPSIREGLNVSIMEAMASGLPVVCGRIRGNTDLIDNNGGALFDPHSVDECKKAITDVIGEDKNNLCAYNLQKVQTMSVEQVNIKMREIYGIR